MSPSFIPCTSFACSRYNGAVKSPNFYDDKWADSNLEIGTIQEVHYSLQKATIIGSNGKTQEQQVPQYSCRVYTDQGRDLPNVPWVSLYLDSRSGSGLQVVPKPLTRVLVAYPKKGNPVIIGFLAPVGLDGSYVANREPMPQGSFMMKTDFGSKILMQEGGVIRLQSTPSCRRTYIPFGDQIRDFCRNYFLTTSGGEFTFTESSDGLRTTALRILVNEKAGDDPGESVRLQMGTHSDNGDDPEPDDPEGKIFSMVVAKNTKVYIGKNGRIKIKNEHPDSGEANDISIESNGKFNLTHMKDIDINSQNGKITLLAGSGGQTKVVMEPNGLVSIKSATQVKIEAPMVELKATQVTLDAQIVRTTEITQLGNGFLPVARLLDQVLVQTKDGPAQGQIMSGSGNTFSS